MTRAPELFDLTGRVAVVTGSTKGIGRAMAEGLAEAGADVVVSSRRQDACDATAAEIARNEAMWSQAPLSGKPAPLPEFIVVSIGLPGAAANPFRRNFEYMPPQQRACLATFFKWLDVESTAPTP